MASEAQVLDTPSNACLSCGACCSSAMAVPVEATDRVPRRLTRSTRGLMGFASWEAATLRTMKLCPDDRQCLALQGSIGQGCRCTIYDKRPRSCREFSPGSDDCLTVRAYFSLPALAAPGPG